MGRRASARGRVGRGLVLAVVGACVVAGLTVDGAAAQEPDCQPGPMPYASVPGASLTPTVHVSLDADPVRYVRWRGRVPTFDGLPLSVDVTVPCGVVGPQPTMLMAHGFTDDKTVWQETGKSDTVESEDRPGSNSRWNNIWFASRGYTVVNYTARGWRDSCGPDMPGATPATPSPECLAYDYWIHLDDKRWEVRDAQWLLGGLVQGGHADADRLAMTGGSYGGAPTLVTALLDDQVMCGGAAVPAELGVDPCAGRGDGELAPWTTPDGATRLRLAVAVPMYTFGDIVHVLAPNGRASDGWEHAPPHGDVTDPVGVPIESTLAGLLAAGNQSGHFAPPGVDPTSDIITDAARVLAGNPFPRQDPIIARALDVYREFKSPITTPPQGRVPIYWVHGLTDPLFPAFEALTVRNAILAEDAGYPITLFLGDLGHDYTGDRVDEWQEAHLRMNAFVDHHLRPDRTPAQPVEVSATVTRCLDHDASMQVATAPTWHGLHPHHVTFASEETGETSTATPGPAGRATDPISTATLPAPGAYKGCRIMRPSEPDPTVATYLFDVTDELVMMGGPVVEVAFTATGPDVPLAVRLWDVAPDGSVQGLVTRHVYRVADAGSGRAEFQLAPQGYRFPAGHRIKVEVTANDAPYYQPSNVPAVVTVEGLTLTLPLLEPPGDAAAPDGPAGPEGPGAPGGQPHAPAPAAPEAPATPVTGGSAGAWAAALLLAALLGAGRSRRGAEVRRLSD